MNATIDASTWALARQIITAGLRTSLHCAVGSINPDGTPHLTPIGSVLLDREVGRGYYLDVFNAQLAANIDADPHVCILAVNSSRLTWIRALVSGTFTTSPGVRLMGTAGPRRLATDVEKDRFAQRVGPALRTKGGKAMWRNIDHVRDLTFDTVKTVRLGSMTSSL
jgi:uncharacterized protein